MASIRDVVAYFCAKYPYSDELSKARLTKLVYLADWKCAIENKSQLTDISWFFHNFGPYVPDVVEEAKRDRAFQVKSTSNAFGNSMDLVSLRDVNAVVFPSLTADDKRILDDVIESTKALNFNQFIELVYGTHPVVTQERFTNFDLVKLASEYRQIKRLD